MIFLSLFLAQPQSAFVPRCYAMGVKLETRSNALCSPFYGTQIANFRSGSLGLKIYQTTSVVEPPDLAKS